LLLLLLYDEYMISSWEVEKKLELGFLKVGVVQEYVTVSAQSKDISGHLKDGRESSNLRKIKIISLNPLFFIPVVLIDW
jgi:hypothetical protein